jgi:hypothetical protein
MLERAHLDWRRRKAGVRGTTYRLGDTLNFRRGRAAAERSSERRRREDEAPRLAAVIPELESLRLEVSEKRGDIGVAEASHIRRVVVDHAPALFLIPCGES